MPKQVPIIEGVTPGKSPFSQVVEANGFVFVAGQVAVDGSGKTVGVGDIGAQTRQVLENLGAVLAAAGASYADVVRTTIFLADMNDFATVNAIYAERFTAAPPSRSTVQAAKLPKAALVEIDAIAVF